MLALTCHRLFEAFVGPEALQAMREHIRGQKVLFMMHSAGHNPPSETLLNDLKIWLIQNGATVTFCRCKLHDSWRCEPGQKLLMTCGCQCHKQARLEQAKEVA